MDAISTDLAEPIATQILRVAIENVMPLWPQIEPLLARELVVIPTHDAEDVRRLLLSNQANLWVQWTDRVEAMAITEFVSYPRGLALRVWLGAAQPDTRMDRDGFFATIQQWARRNRCRWIDACGRHGWLKVFPDAKYSGMFMRVTVDWGAS